MVNLDFRPLFRTAEDRAANRREQMRKAQRTFRERRDQYLKLLEGQVRHLQMSEAKLQHETDRLQFDLSRLNAKLAQYDAEVHLLRQSLALNGVKSIGASSRVGGEGKVYDMSMHRNKPLPSTVVRLETLGGELRRIHVRNGRSGSNSESEDMAIPDSLHEAAAQGCALDDIGRLDTEAVTQALGSRDHSSEFMIADSQVYVAKLDTVIVGMEFVLKLESPCLPHIHGSTNDSSSPHGHVHTASATLLCCAPFDTAPSLSQSCNSLEWDAPRPTLERLLNISAILPLEWWEVTPIQAWTQIRQHRDFEGLKMDRLSVLADKLLSHVKCYGFGAVIKQDFLNKSLLEAFL